jgi:hypothetical protein
MHLSHNANISIHLQTAAIKTLPVETRTLLTMGATHKHIHPLITTDHAQDRSTLHRNTGIHNHQVMKQIQIG